MAVPELQPIEGKYEILEKLNEGGMGAVYKVRHRLLEEVRVIKVIRPQLQSDENLRRRFLREARAAVRLRHPNIAHLYDFTVADDGTAYMVIEFIDGVDLVQVIDPEKLPDIGLVLDIGVQSLKALSYLHSKQFVHRDISPDNLMLTKDVDGRALIKLIDLGIAKPLQSEMSLTGEGLFLGKIRYASPEQFGGPSGDDEIDHRSDLYSLGVVIYELLTGCHPITGDDNQTLLAGHLFHPPRNFGETDPTGRVPDELRSIILKALAKSADERFPDASAFSNALVEFAGQWPRSGGAEVDLGATLIRSDLDAPPRRPGSTQEKLDREFSPHSRPAPRPLEAVPSDDGVEKESRVQACCERIEHLISSKRLLEAEVELQRGEGREGRSVLFEDLRKRIDQQREQAAQAAIRARLLLRNRDLEKARAQIRAAREIDQEDPEIASLHEEIERAIASRDKKIEAMCQTIESQLESGLLDEAHQKLGQAIEEFGRLPELTELEERVDSLLAAADRVRRIAEEAAKVGELIERGELHRASAALTAAARTLGEDEMFNDLAEQIDELEQRQREAQTLEREAERRRELRSILELTERRIEVEDFDEAVEQLEKAGEIEPRHPQIASLKARIDSGRREQQASGLLDRAHSHIEAGELDEATQLVDQALAVSPGIARGTKLQRVILERRREEDLLHDLGDQPRPAIQRLLSIPRPVLVVGLFLVVTLAAFAVVLVRKSTVDSARVGQFQGESAEPPSETLGELLQGKSLGDFHALVIGNNQYENGLPDLDTAVNDARQLAASLDSQYGFETELLLNATRYETLSALEAYIDRLDLEDNLLLFYAGHGFVDEVTGRGYWQPTDAEPDNTSNWISSLEVTDVLLDVPARRVLVIADSCFSGAFAGTPTEADGPASPASPQEIIDRLDLRSRQVFASGSQLPIADNGGDGHSVFSRALLNALGQDRRALDATMLFESVSEQVSRATIGKELPQNPQLSPLDSDGGGVFVFVQTDDATA